MSPRSTDAEDVDAPEAPEDYLHCAAARLNELDALFVKTRRLQVEAAPDGKNETERRGQLREADRGLEQATHLLARANNLFSRGCHFDLVRTRLEAVLQRVEAALKSTRNATQGRRLTRV